MKTSKALAVLLAAAAALTLLTGATSALWNWRPAPG